MPSSRKAARASTSTGSASAGRCRSIYSDPQVAQHDGYMERKPAWRRLFQTPENIERFPESGFGLRHVLRRTVQIPQFIKCDRAPRGIGRVDQSALVSFDGLRRNGPVFARSDRRQIHTPARPDPIARLRGNTLKLLPSRIAGRGPAPGPPNPAPLFDLAGASL